MTKAIGSLLRFLLSTGTAIADATVEAIDIAANIDKPGLLRPPRSIKRALEWLISCCSDGNKDSLEKALKKLPGFSDNSNIKDLLQKLGGDTPDGIYANAKWEDLCKKQGSGTSCCASTRGKGGCSGCKGSGKSCDGCCYDCPQIICARMFCLILPIVYYFLEYLIKFDEKAKNNSNDTELKKLLSACGFVTDDMDSVDGSGSNTKLKELLKAINKVKEALKKGCNNADSQQSSLATTAHKEGAKEPKTIRDMMLWLQGLPYCPQFHELTKKIREKCEKLQGGNNNGVTCEKVLENLFDTACRLPGMFLTVEGTSSYFMKDLMEGCLGYTNEQCFMYKENGEELLKQFCEYTYKVHTQLRYLMNMCSYGNENGGWWQCILRHEANGQGNARSNPVKCKCKGYAANGCSQPLKAFLNQNKTSAQGTSDADHNIPMGFDRHNPSRTLFNGWDLYYLIKELIDPINTSSQSSSTKPLSLLTQYCVAIGEMEPDSLGDLFAFFLKLGTEWDNLKLHGQNGDTFKQKLETELDQYKIGTGDKQKACDELRDKIKALCSEQHKDHNTSLSSLMCTTNTNGGTCTPYMKSLSQGVYHYYLPSITGSGDSTKFGAFQYLYDMLRKLLDKMKELKKEFEKCPCCKSSGTPCTGLIQCPNAHPILYKFGFVFGSPGTLKSGTKKCNTLKDQLDKVLSCTQGQESTLFSAFECVIQVTYKVLLEKAKGCVTTKADGLKNGLFKDRDTDKTQWQTAFDNYVENAMYDSYPKLICTFACKVFDDKHDCNGDTCKNRFKETTPGPKPKALSTSTTLQVTKSNVTSITAVIPQYTAPVIDRYHYKVFKKSTTPGSNDKSTHYSFRDALDFHIKGAQCIRPTPVALRSVIDWILRVTVGAIATQKGKENGKKNNDNISKLSEKVVEVFQKSGMTGSDVNNNNIQSHLTDLVFGLRKFVGYKDKSQSVKTNVTTVLGTNGNNGVKGALKKNIEALNNFIGTAGKANFASELGKALLKGRYEVKGDHIMNLVDAVIQHVDIVRTRKYQHGTPFMSVIKMLQNKLEAKHTHCDATYCKDFNKDSNSQSADSQSGSGTVQAEGLKDLYTFFEQLQKFAALWTTIGNGNGILQQQKGLAATEVSKNCNGSSSANGEYFNKLHRALEKLGECAQKVSDLNNNNGDKNSNDYRGKITALIDGLKAFGTHIKGCNFNAGQDTEKNNNGSDPAYAVNGAQRLIEETKKGVEKEITGRLAWGFKESYNNAYSYGGLTLKITELIGYVSTQIHIQLDFYKSHLDDLKQLCQWLYRMGQLYAHGLKGFVESLVQHLEHIIQVIKWIEGIEKMMTKLKEIENKDKLCETISDFNDIKDCCTTHQSLYNSNKFSSRDDFFTALNCRIDHLLKSYVLSPLTDSSDQNNDKQIVQTRIQLLQQLRLLALDRYTLQVWQDECKPNGGRQSAIKDWITFKDGIIRHSDLEAIKEALHTLTGVAYNNASPRASPSASHRVHDFHAICVIQKFSYEAPIARLERSLKELRGIQGQLSAVKQKCNGGTELQNDQDVQKFSESVTDFLKEPYGIYSLAKFFHTIMGPNIFSAVIAALEELTTDKLSGVKGQNSVNDNGEKKAKFCGIVTTMCEGLDGENKEHYRLESIITKLTVFITTIRREYIFCYPVVTCTAQNSVPASPRPQPQALTTASATTATGILDRLKNVMLPCPSNFHNEASVCPKCYNVFAYILLGQVPKLYHSFRFMSWMLNNGWTKQMSKINEMTGNDQTKNTMKAKLIGKITSYLVSMGYDNDKIQNVQGGNPSTAANTLHTTFKSALTTLVPNPSPPTPPTSHEPKGLTEIHDKLEQLLKKLLQVQHERALQSIANGGTDTRRRPRTIREMLHWLSGVPFSVVYSEMQQFSNSLCDSTLAMTRDKNGEQKMKHTIHPEWISYRLGVSCAECLDVLQAVEDPLGKEPQKRYREYIATHDFYYPASASELFYMFVDIIYNVYVQMKFVCNMTGRGKTEGGWERCEFVRDDAKVVQQYNKHNIQCECLGSFVEHRCAGPLRRLLSSVSTVFTGKSLGFQLPKEKLYNAPVLGSVIHNVIKHIFGKGDNYPTLCRFLLAVSTCPPTSIGDMISFLYWYKQRMFVGNSADENSKKTADIYKNALHHEIELFPGTFDASKLTGALGALMSAHTGTSGRTTSGTTHTHNLSSVMYCEDAMVVKPQPQPPAPAPQTQQPSDPSASCAPYLRPLAQEIYNVYVPQFSRAYLSWILHFGPRVYTALEELKGKLNGNCEHCKKSDSSIVTCNSVLPELYSKGLDFYDPKVLNGQKKNQQNGSYQQNGGTKRTCVFFATQLGAVLRTCSPGNPSSPGAPLHRLIEAIEQFLWSIRMPFSLVQLSLWSVAILFISYVFVVPLDHFKIKSHLFNRLKYTMHPSLLIADGQRRVSEVAYFSL